MQNSFHSILGKTNNPFQKMNINMRYLPHMLLYTPIFLYQHNVLLLRTCSRAFRLKPTWDGISHCPHIKQIKKTVEAIKRENIHITLFDTYISAPTIDVTLVIPGAIAYTCFIMADDVLFHFFSVKIAHIQTKQNHHPAVLASLILPLHL